MINHHLNALGRITLLVTFNLSLLACGGSGGSETTADNIAPVAVDDTVVSGITEDVLYNSVTSLLTNDSDLDVITVVPGTFATSQGGSISFNTNGSYSYTSASNFNGVDTVNYNVTDGALTDTGLLTLTVSAVNDAPVATDASVSLLPGSSVTGTLVVNDVDGDNQAISIVTDISNGTLTLDNATTGAYTYAHSGTVNGDSFTFSSNDGLLDSNIATVTITTSAPATPTNGLTTINGDLRVTLNWDPVPGADSYTVYRSNIAGTGTAGDPFSVTKPPFYSDGLNNGTTYYYVVEAVNAVGSSDASVEMSATPNLIRLDSLTFIDPNLDACVETYTGFTYVSQLTMLICDLQSISQLGGIEALSSLSFLDLNNNTISDIAPLVGLKSLVTLKLLSNKNISDVSSLSELTKLDSLFLGDNAISDVSSLADLKNLTTLSLEQNNISDVSALVAMVELTRLTLQNNSLININALVGMTKMDILNISNASIVDVSPLAGMTVMTFLTAESNSIEDVSQLSTLTGLKSLSIRSNSITDVSALASLVNLTYLDLRVNTLGAGATGGRVDTLSTLTIATSILLSNNFGMDCGELQSLINDLPGVVDPATVIPGVNCTAI